MSLAKGEFEEKLQEWLRERLADSPKSLSDSIRNAMLARDKHLRARILLAAAQMMSVAREAAWPAAIALEMLYFASRTHDELGEVRSPLTFFTDNALVPLAFEAFLDSAPHVEPEGFSRAFRRILQSAGPSGILGGQVEWRELSGDSTLDELRQANAKRSSFFFASVLVPKDFVGLADDSSEGLALDLFARELALALHAVRDFKVTGEDKISPAHLLHYLPAKEAKNMTLQRLNSASLSLSSIWGAPAQALVQIAEEVAREIQAAPSE